MVDQYFVFHNVSHLPSVCLWSLKFCNIFICLSIMIVCFVSEWIWQRVSSIWGRSNSGGTNFPETILIYIWCRKWWLFCNWNGQTCPCSNIYSEFWQGTGQPLVFTLFSGSIYELSFISGASSVRQNFTHFWRIYLFLEFWYNYRDECFTVLLVLYLQVRMDPRNKEIDHDRLMYGPIGELTEEELKKQEGDYIYRYRYNGGGASQVWLSSGR